MGYQTAGVRIDEDDRHQTPNGDYRSSGQRERDYVVRFSYNILNKNGKVMSNVLCKLIYC